MPTSTFINLPEEKKQRIINAALDEFSSYPYFKASVSRIVSSANIAKGSFYQYFEDKKELFKYIISIMGEKKLKYLEGILERKSELSFFEILEELYKAGIKFAKDHPRLDKIGHKLFVNSGSEIFEEIMAVNKEKSIQFFIMLLREGIKKGEVDEKIDLELTAHLLTSTNISLGELFYRDGEVNMDDMELVKKMLYIFKNGLKKD